MLKDTMHGMATLIQEISVTINDSSDQVTDVSSSVTTLTDSMMDIQSSIRVTEDVSRRLDSEVAKFVTGENESSVSQPTVVQPVYAEEEEAELTEEDGEPEINEAAEIDIVNDEEERETEENEAALEEPEEEEFSEEAAVVHVDDDAFEEFASFGTTEEYEELAEQEEE